MNHLKNSIGISLLMVLAVCFWAGSAQAGEAPKHRGPVPFSDFDQDGSGFVSEDEFTAVRGQRMAAMAEDGRKMRCASTEPSFTDIDTDDDGLLSEDELNAGHKAHRQKCQAMNHRHGSGQMAGQHGKGGQCKCEGGGSCQCKGRKSGRMPTFADFDLDGDGRITETEFNTVHAKKMSEMAAQGRQMNHAGNGPGFSGIDANGDGEISKDEFAAHQAEYHGGKHQGDQQPR